MAANLQVQYAFANVSASGDSILVPAQTGQRIIVLQCCVIVSAANNVQFETQTGSAAVSALFPLAQNGGFVLPYSELGWFQTSIGDGLLFNISAATPVAIQLVWCPSNT
jgi:hypothetical protein